MHRFSLSSQRKLKTVLNFRYTAPKKTLWHLKTESLIPVVQSILPVINRFDDSSWPQNLQLLKGKKGDRIVFRVNSSPSCRESFVVKICPFLRFKHKLEYTLIRHHMFGLSEAANLVTAAGRRLNVPEVYGYGCVYDSFRLIKMSVVILEDLNHYRSVEALLGSIRGDDRKCEQILERTIPVFVGLYKAECNNIEINLHSVMLSENKSRPDAFILDFEGAKFHNKPSLEILMFEAASFVKWTPKLLTEAVITDWLFELFDAIEVDDSGVRKKLIERFNYYRGAKLHRKDRRKIR